MSTNILDEFPALEDDDVHILHEIIQVAESSKEPPFRALFSAYDKVLAAHGIEKASDRLYFRFLLRMREGNTKSTALFDQFRSLLDKLGIEVSLPLDEEPKQGDDAPALPSTSAVQQPQSHREGTRSSFVGSRDAADLQRHSSLSSLSDAATKETQLRQAAEQAQLTKKRSFDSLTAGHLKPNKVRFVDNGIFSPQNRGETTRFSGTQNDSPERRHDAGPNTADQPDIVVYNSNRDLKDKIEQEIYDSGLSDMTSDYTDGDHVPVVDHRREDAAHNDQQVEAVTHDGLEQMETRAKSLRFHHEAAHCIAIFRGWAARARQAQASRTQFQLSADSAYNGRLKRRAFDSWQAALKNREKAIETQAFYAQLEKKAVRARDYYLLTKAFTHWAQCTEEELLLKSAARRHVLRTQYFNAWRDVTVVNELKVRRVFLSKWMGKWRRRAGICVSQSEKAAEFDENRISSRFYRRWFWQFCDNKAPAWYESRLKASFFHKWLDWSRQSVGRDRWAVQFGDLTRLRTAFTTWRSRLSKFQLNSQQADVFHRRKLTRIPFDDIRQETRLSSVRDQVTQLVDNYALRKTIRSWSWTTKLYIEARHVNELRIMRNAWTAWNDHLRVKVLEKSINWRVSAAALYKWVIAERLLLCERVSSHKLKSSMLLRWREQATAKHAHFENSLLAFRSKVDRRVLRGTFEAWNRRCHSQQESLNTATSWRAHRVQSNAINELSQGLDRRLKHIHTLSTWSDIARFYVLCKPTFRTWAEATSAHRRDRRRAAYAQVRKRVKIRTAREILSTWRQRTSAITDLDVIAANTYRARLTTLLVSLLVIWHERMTTIAAQNSTAETMLTRTRLSTQLSQLLTQLRAVTALDNEASTFRTDTITATASSSIRSLSRALFSARRLDETADSLRERNYKRHVRGMIKYWAERTAAKRNTDISIEDANLDDISKEDDVNPDSPLPPPSSVPRHQITSMRHSQRTFSASVGPGSFIPLSTRNPSARAAAHETPGYLRTPLRRTAAATVGRSRAPFSAAATTAPPLATPLPTRLRQRPDAYVGGSVGRAAFTRRLLKDNIEGD